GGQGGMSDGNDGNDGQGNGGGLFNYQGFVTLNNSTVEDNTATNQGGGIWNGNNLDVTGSTLDDNTARLFGGGVYNAGTGDTSLSNTTVSQNKTLEVAGGGLFNRGELSVLDSLIDNNEAVNAGGGIENQGVQGPGMLEVLRSTISNNVSGFVGGGVSSSLGTVSVVESTVNNNQSDDSGGGINAVGSTVTVENSTVSANTTNGGGGGIYGSLSALTVSSSTIVENTADADANPITGLNNGGGIASLSTANVKNSIIANNIDNSSFGNIHPDVSGSFVSGGYNLIGDGTGSGAFTAAGDQVGTPASPIDPMLGALQDNGGPTFTHALLSGSPALDAANPGDFPATDQRGTARPQGAQPDIGAYEKVSFAGPGGLTIRGTNRRDVLIGTDGNDTILGRKASDRIDAGAGDDLIDGGRGRDQITTGTGMDTILFTGLTGRDKVFDFEVSMDKLDISALVSIEDRSDRIRLIDIDDRRGSGTLIQVDAKGDRFKFKNLVLLAGVQTSDITSEIFILGEA
ncbi:MAG: choice-of-anchor Q domain-containing protein, partial [Cyanobacteria bacterium P01_F01_bin.4]